MSKHFCFPCLGKATYSRDLVGIRMPSPLGLKDTRKLPEGYQNQLYTHSSPGLCSAACLQRSWHPTTKQPISLHHTQPIILPTHFQTSLPGVCVGKSIMFPTWNKRTGIFQCQSRTDTAHTTWGLEIMYLQKYIRTNLEKVDQIK